MQRLGGPVVRGGQAQPISPLVRADGPLLFVSGQVPIIGGKIIGDDITTQTNCVIDQIEQILTLAGARLDNIVKCTVWLVDKNDYPAFNTAYANRFPPDRAPARSTVISDLIVPVLVEMEAIAEMPDKS